MIVQVFAVAGVVAGKLCGACWWCCRSMLGALQPIVLLGAGHALHTACSTMLHGQAYTAIATSNSFAAATASDAAADDTARFWKRRLATACKAEVGRGCGMVGSLLLILSGVMHVRMCTWSRGFTTVTGTCILRPVVSALVSRLNTPVIPLSSWVDDPPRCADSTHADWTFSCSATKGSISICKTLI